MKSVIVDTSALLACLVAGDRAHQQAVAAFEQLAIRETPLTTTSYVLVETYALLARRYGMPIVRRFRHDFGRLLDVVWIDDVMHERAVDRWLAADRRELSLVDVSCFVVADALDIEEAFAFDPHFEEAGLRLVG